jgi:NADH-quinone oxidoreductase subunit L
MTHAFFKATLFLGSGSVIMACHHEQDMRKMGGLAKYTPITRWTYLIACITIAGFPVASGFYSKDEILWKAWTAQGLAVPWLGKAIYLIGAVAALGTSFYMFRSYFMTFTGEYRGAGGHADKERQEDPHAMATHAHATAALMTAGAAHQAHVHAASDVHQHDASAGAQPDAHDDHGHGGVPHESPASMTYVLIALAAASVLALVFGLPQLWTHKVPLFEQWLEPSLTAQEGVPFETTPHSTEWLFQGIGLAIAGGGALIAMWLYRGGTNPLPARLKEFFFAEWSIVYNKYYIDEIYDATIVRPARWLGRATYWFDQNVIDGLVNLAGWLGRSVGYLDAAIDKYVVDGAVNGVADLAMGSGRLLRKAQSGSINAYLFGALGGALIFVIVQYVIR